MSPADGSDCLHAPAQDGQILSVPPIEQAGQFLTSNRQQLADRKTDHQRRWLAELASTARRELLEAALDFTRAYCAPRIADADIRALAERPIVMTGHQAGFFHPGVWLKNFTTAHLAKASGGTAIHLIIDSDLCRNPAIQVPTGTMASPRVQTVPFDRASNPMPMEERLWLDRSLWDSFGQRVNDTITSLIPESMIRSWWKEVSPLSARAPSLGLGLARARHLTEIAWQCHGLELPQSRVCQLPSFGRFAFHLLAELPRFHKSYNGALADYRVSHHVRNHAQPVPDLGVKDGWLETPFWIWSTTDPRRRPLYAQHSAHGLKLTDHHHFFQQLPEIGNGSAEEIARECFAHWESRGVKLRTRALLTTMFARLILADLFIHGIGGAKYDHVTDEISLRFFGILPPSYMTLSGTLRLPTEAEATDPNQRGTISQKIRQLQYHPERFVDWMNIPPAARDEVQNMIDQKLSMIRMPKTRQNAVARHHAITEANTALQPWLETQHKSLQQESIVYERKMRSNRILLSREYAYCLFSQDRLQHFLLDFSPPIG